MLERVREGPSWRITATLIALAALIAYLVYGIWFSPSLPVIKLSHILSANDIALDECLIDDTGAIACRMTNIEDTGVIPPKSYRATGYDSRKRVTGETRFPEVYLHPGDSVRTTVFCCDEGRTRRINVAEHLF
jgi:hypothetical protein